jgi:predicted dienelactone hydrolase
MRLPTLLLALATTAAAPYHAGLLHLTVPDSTPFDTTIWYPTATHETTVQTGPFTLQAAPDAPIAPDTPHPVVLLSHGSGGTPMGHRDLARSLAERGYVVVLPTQIGDSAGHMEGNGDGSKMADRPRQAERALNAALADPRLAPHLDPARIGAIGYSAGGYTVLVLAGARPDFGRITAWCQAHPTDAGSCGHNPVHPNPDLLTWQPRADPRIRAVVVMDPLAMPFGARALARVHVPVLVFRARDDDYLPAGPNAEALVAGLIPPPERVVEPGGHAVFIDPCPPVLAAEIPAVCQDAPGIDRGAVHRDIETRIAAFLDRTL